jgi:hypothetical protein
MSGPVPPSLLLEVSAGRDSGDAWGQMFLATAEKVEQADSSRAEARSE